MTTVLVRSDEPRPKKHMPKDLSKPFLLILVFIVLAGCYLVFRPFLTEILIAAIMASVFYKPYIKLAGWLGGRRYLAASLMCLLLVIIIILPSIKILIYTGQKSVDAYSQTVTFFNNHSVNDLFKTPFFQQGALRSLNLASYDFNNETFKGIFLNALQKSSEWLLSGATLVLKETTNFFASLLVIIITTLFFFVDGKKMLNWLMYLSPLPNKYDREIFTKFRSVSYTIFLSTFVTAIAQGLVGAIGFAIVGFPALLAFVIITLLSFLPYIGSTIFYIPLGIYYLLIGDVWQGIFILLWGAFIIGTTDNFIRAYMIKDKAEINPIFVLFAVLGGVIMFGFWGVILGPLIVALAVTVLHIYTLEFSASLEKVPAFEEDKLEKLKLLRSRKIAKE